MKYLLSLIIVLTTIFSSPVIVSAVAQTGHITEEPAVNSASESASTSVDHSAVKGEAEHSEQDQSVLGRFGINWKSFIAQLINFSIILLVLWKWVFGPVTKGLSERTQKIEKSLADAAKIAEDRETFDSWKNNEMAGVKKEASGILTQAKKDAQALQEQMLGETKQEQTKLVEQAKQQIETEKTKALQDIKAEAAQMIVAATEAVLKSKIDAKKDAALIDAALKNQGGKV